MGYTKVKSYTDKELLDRVKSLPGYLGIPNGRWFINVGSIEDTPNVYDDKSYVFEGEKFIEVMTCTVNPGTEALKGGYKRYNQVGAAVIKMNQWCYDCFGYGLHNGRMPALRQIGKIWYHRDGDGDDKSEELGAAEFANYNTNYHSNTYKYFNSVVRWLIGPWSYGCVVNNSRLKYIKNIKWFKAAKYSGKQRKVTMCFIREF